MTVLAIFGPTASGKSAGQPNRNKPPKPNAKPPAHSNWRRSRHADRQELEHVRNLPGWEYKVIRVSDRRQSGMAGADQMESQFNQLGGRGWELIAVSQERAIFKRPALRDPAGPLR